MKKNGKIKKNWIRILVLAIIIIALGIGIFNIFFIKNCNFWTVNISQLLTIIVAVIIAFWATQRKTEERRIKDQIEKITYKIQDVVTAPNFIQFESSAGSENISKILNLNTRKINNCVTLLKEYSEIINIKDEIEYISEQVTEYREFISEKTGDIEYLKKSETYLRKLSDNIVTKCDFIILKLYK